MFTPLSGSCRIHTRFQTVHLTNVTQTKDNHPVRLLHQGRHACQAFRYHVLVLALSGGGENKDDVWKMEKPNVIDPISAWYSRRPCLVGSDARVPGCALGGKFVEVGSQATLLLQSEPPQLLGISVPLQRQPIKQPPADSAKAYWRPPKASP